MVDIPFYETFHGTRRVLQHLKDPVQIYSAYFTLLDLVQPASISQILSSPLNIVVPFFSEMKRLLHVYINDLPPLAYCYSELETICGYPIAKYRVQDDSAFDWLTKPTSETHSAAWWFVNILRVFQTNRAKPRQVLLSLREFIHNRWLWVTSGASSESEAIFNQTKLKTKFGAAISLSDDQLFHLVEQAQRPENFNIQIFVKPDERGYKKRLIANVKLGGYLIAAYIRYLIEWYQGSEPKWMTATLRPDDDVTIIQLLQQGQRAVPLDESKYDYHVSRESWLGLISVLHHLFPDNEGVQAFDRFFSVSRWYDRSNHTFGPWLKGMPSGLAITSIGNTLFNYVKQSAVESPVHYALGDDALIFNEQYTLTQLELYYDTFGAVVNSKKNWESRAYAEFLHYLYTRHSRAGYPARIYGSMIYALKFTDVTPMVRLNELATLWYNFFVRAQIEPKQDIIYRDLSRAVSTSFKWPTSTIDKWIHSPAALGGYGMLPYQYYRFKIKTKTVDYFYENVRINPGPVKVPIKTTVSIHKYIIAPRSFVCIRPPRLPPITTLEEWEMLLRHESPLDSQSRTREDYGLIPLPRLPNVSVSVISMFARKWNFYEYYNLHGTFLARTSRLIAASIFLAAKIQEFMHLRFMDYYA